MKISYNLSPLPAEAVNPQGPVFISYRQSDGCRQANDIERLLRAAGLVVWRDKSDLPAGNIDDHLEQVLTSGLSAAVLIVTPDIEQSTVMQEREVPRLLQLSENLDFSLCIVNEIADPSDPSRLDYKAPDRLLKLAPNTLAKTKQYDTRDQNDRLKIVHDLLFHRVKLLQPKIAAAGGVFTIYIQTRGDAFALDAGRQSDLQIRLEQDTNSRLPARSSLEALRDTLPIITDAVVAAQATTVRLEGGMHLTVALSIGAALPSTKIGQIEATDIKGKIWSSDDKAIVSHPHQLTIDPINVNDPEHAAKQAVAVFVTLTPQPDPTAFNHLLNDYPGKFTKAIQISADPPAKLSPDEAGSLARKIGDAIKNISAQTGRAEIHLAFHGPYGMAVLVGRLLNTLRTVVYEWDNPPSQGPRYYEVMTLEPGVAKGPIVAVAPTSDKWN